MRSIGHYSIENVASDLLTLPIVDQQRCQLGKHCCIAMNACCLFESAVPYGLVRLLSLRSLELVSASCLFDRLIR